MELKIKVKDSIIEKWHKISLEADKIVPQKFTKASVLFRYLKI